MAEIISNPHDLSINEKIKMVQESDGLLIELLEGETIENLYLGWCKSLTHLPNNLKIKQNLTLLGCSSLKHIPDDLEVGGVVMYWGDLPNISTFKTEKLVSYDELTDMVNKYINKRLNEDNIRTCSGIIDKNIHLRYSVFKTITYKDGNEEWIVRNNLEEIAAEGEVQLIASYRNLSNYKSQLLNDPTWAEVAYEAEKMLRAGNNNHHIFLETIYSDEDDKNEPIKTLRFSMGS